MRNSEQALRLWEGAAPEDPKSYFRAQSWRRLVRPLSETPTIPEAENGEMRRLNHFLKDLPEGAFFDFETYATIERTATWSNQLEEVYWLKLLELLRQQDYEAAYAHLKQPTVAGRSYNQAIYRALHLALEYKRFGLFNAANIPVLALEGENVPVVLRTRAPACRARGAEDHAKDPVAFPAVVPDPALQSTRDLLASDSLFPGILLAGGWREAALTMGADNPPTADGPEWLVTLWSNALLSNRGPEQAAEYLAALETRTTNLDLLYAGLLLQTGEGTKAQEIADKYRAEESPEGFEAL